MIDLIEQLHDMVKPANEKPIIQKLIETEENKEFDFSCDSIECFCNDLDRMFCVNITDHLLIEEYLEYNDCFIDQNQVESLELMDVTRDKEFLEEAFMRRINSAYEL